MASSDLLTEGSWVVHQGYGTGQVRGSKTKQFGEAPKVYYQIVTPKMTLWVSEETAAAQVRPVAEPKVVKAAIELLKEPAEMLSDNNRTRELQLKAITPFNSMDEIATMICSLRRWKLKNGVLTGSDRQSWDRLTHAFASEWGISLGVEIGAAEKELVSIVEKYHPKDGDKEVEAKKAEKVKKAEAEKVEAEAEKAEE